MGMKPYMAFGITRVELARWKASVLKGDIAFLTHYWLDDRFPGVRTVTKVGCSDLERLAKWCLDTEYIHNRPLFPTSIYLVPSRRKFYRRKANGDN